MIRWGMVIDLRKCIGCGACTALCSQTNKIVSNMWRRVVDCGISGPPERQRMCLPMSCMHCSKPPCLEVCPTTATYRRADGIVDINYELCVGCGQCIVACPFQSRSIIFNNESDSEEDMPQESSVANSDLDRVGVCSKCNFCLPRVDAGMAKGLQPGVDPEATPLCVISCTAKALHFGNLDDHNSVVSRLIRENKTARLQEELETDPSTYYIID